MPEKIGFIPVGNTLRPEEIYSVRTSEQQAKVKEIIASDEFHFACGNPLTLEVGTYTGVFCFTYYTKNHVLKMVRIGRRGNILRTIETS